ncbi:MAG TPA: hypothetical protein PLQ49_10035 [Methanothrix sp.]|nr:hypothetical protein [Methanothrix sp.]
MEAIEVEEPIQEDFCIDPEITSYWENRIERGFVQQFGQHICEIGRPGTGKTQGLYYLVDKIKEYGKEQILWFDIGKGDEILTLCHYFGPVTIFTPPGCELDIKFRGKTDAFGNPYDIRFETLTRAGHIWNKIEKDRINICSFDPFILDPVVTLSEMSFLFEQLIRKAFRREIIRPLAIVYDEFHNVCPSQGYGYATSRQETATQRRSLNMIKRNVQKLRVEQYRMIVTTHEWQQLFKGVRMAFEWVMIRRGAKFGTDEPRLAQFNPRWAGIKKGQCYIALPTREHTAPLQLPYYLDGFRLGTVTYRGMLE